MPLMSEVKQTGKRGERIGTFLSWMLAVLACLWVAWCCAIGPLYWFGDGAFRLRLAECAVFGGRFRDMVFDSCRIGQIRPRPSRTSAIFRTTA